jgi:hypothetical protein
MRSSSARRLACTAASSAITITEPKNSHRRRNAKRAQRPGIARGEQRLGDARHRFDLPGGITAGSSSTFIHPAR